MNERYRILHEMLLLLPANRTWTAHERQEWLNVFVWLLDRLVVVHEDIAEIVTEIPVLSEMLFGCGHPKTPENLSPIGKKVRCRICHNLRMKQYYYQKRALQS